MSSENIETVTDNVSVNHQFRDVAKMIPHEEVDVSKMETTTPTGNAAAMRDALMEASIALSSATHHHMTEDDAKDCLAVIEKAISEPPRNCDKYRTAKEAFIAFEKMCQSKYCNVCPFSAVRNECMNCRLNWLYAEADK